MKDPEFVHKLHPFSKELEHHAFTEAIKHRVPLSLDTTEGNWRKWRDRIQTMRDAGYHHIALAHARVRPEVAWQRNTQRERVVPRHIFDEQIAEHSPQHPHNEGQTPFQHLSRLVDKVHVHDSENEQERAQRAAAGWAAYRASERRIMGKAGEMTLVELFCALRAKARGS